MTFTATVFNIDFTGSQTTDTNDNLTAAHIHAGPTVTPTTNGGVVWGFIGAPFNDNNPNDMVVTPFATRIVGERSVGSGILPKETARPSQPNLKTSRQADPTSTSIPLNLAEARFAGRLLRS